MELPRDGIEYARITFTDYPDGATDVEASLDRSTWVPFDIPPTVQTDGTWLGRVLLRGPDAPAGGGLAVADQTTLWVRVVDTPEVVPVRAGTIYLT